MEAKTLVDVVAIPEEVIDEPTAKIQLAMAGAARMVEEAFAVAHAQALGAYFDALVDDGIAHEDPTAVERAKRVMVVALARVRASNHDKTNGDTKLYNKTPVPTNT